MLIFVLLYLLFRSAGDVVSSRRRCRSRFVGGFWLIWALGHAISVATAVGFIALSGVAAEFGVVMLVYLKHAHEHRLSSRRAGRRADAAGYHPRGGRPARAAQSLTVAVIIAGHCCRCCSVMARAPRSHDHIAAPAMVGSMVSTAADHVRHPCGVVAVIELNGACRRRFGNPSVWRATQGLRREDRPCWGSPWGSRACAII